MADAKQTGKPHWWDGAHDLSWDKVKKGVLDEWHTVATEAGKLEKKAAESAISLGHGARAAYDKFQKWTPELEAKLKADWEQTKHDADHSWDKVRDAVKHGYDSATKKPAK